MTRAWRAHELGEPAAVLVLDDVEPPAPGPGEVAIDVAAGALNFADVLLCRGEYQVKPPLPLTPGAEVAGTVRAVGEGVEGVRVGERVIAVPVTGRGGFAEQAVAPARAVFPVPDGIDWGAAAALHVVYQTGHLALHHRARIQPGEVLLVHAGAGGAGSAAIQLGVAAGARVLATAGGPDKVAICRDLGADVAIDYRAADFVDAVLDATDGRGADVVYDPVGGDTFLRSTKCVAFEGRILVVGFASGRIPELRANHVFVKNYAVVGVHWGLYEERDPGRIRAIHGELVRLLEAGAIAPLVSRRVPLEAVPVALTDLAARGTHGKVVWERALAG